MNAYGSVLIVRRQRRNNDGDLVGDGRDRVLRGWLFEPEPGVEDRDGGRGTREAAVTRLRGYCRSDTPDIRTGDRAYLADDDRAQPPRWHVIGEPQRHGSTGWMNGGTVVTLEKVVG